MENKKKNTIVQSEEDILKFWEKEKIFEKSVSQREGCPIFSFYDGPPFATGQPHYGNLLPSTIKDVVLRYQTMRGRYAPRRVGWDCHGLPLENMAEKELNQRCKADIEEMGIDKFNQTCRNMVFRCVDDFETVLKRLGRWADYRNYYATVDPLYTESVWWIFKYLHQKKLVYRDYRTAPYCPRCGTPLSNFELNQPGAYRGIKDTSVFVKFSLKEKEHFLVWTTTPWTLPANFAVAVNPEADYVKVKQGDEVLILARSRLSVLKGDFQEIEGLRGSDLVGQSYQPIYPMPPNDGRDYRIVPADFVALEEGTGLVHLAAFGLEDMQVAKEHDLPLKITVDHDGRVVVGHNLPGEGKIVWEADRFVLADLKERGLLYQEMEIEHSYPFCWRCHQRLIYYPTTSWYISVEKFRDQLVENNKQINWIPDHLKEGRFGKWLEGARDWAVSRSRYWGAPLPVWISEDGSETVVIGSREDLIQQEFTSNQYWLMRHGEAENNVKKILVDSEHGYPLTETGKKQAVEAAEKMKKEKIDVIFSSNVARAKETAEIVGRVLGVKPQYFSELGERKFGVANEKADEEYRRVFSSPAEYLTHSPEGGETGLALRQRVYNFIRQKDREYEGKKILIISHRGPLRSLQSACQGLTNKEHTARRGELGLELGEIRKMKLVHIPLNEKGELDLHRPYIDQVEFLSSSGRKMRRIEEVFDCWYESGAMPYAQNHFPFEKKEETKEFFPADFISEGLEQTRGWFYTLHVLATALTMEDIGLGLNKPAFKNVIAHGLILSDTGEKLSKHLANYTPPSEIIDLYGADALRLYFLTQASLGSDYMVEMEKIKEVSQKLISTFDNCAQFYLTYGLQNKTDAPTGAHLLDQWIISRLNRLGVQVIEEMESYRVDRAARLFLDFMDDFSNWYIRRSRSRFQDSGPEAASAASTLREVLEKVSTLMAPLAPFISEKVYRSIRLEGSPESVHLKDYFTPNSKMIDDKLEEEMNRVRQIVRLALQARAKSGQKVRQPLSCLEVKGSELTNPALLDLIAEEVNVKKVLFVDQLNQADGRVLAEEDNMAISLLTEITSELKAEGQMREIIRTIQSMRKKAGLIPSDRIRVFYQGPEELSSLIAENQKSIRKENRADKIEPLEAEGEYLVLEEIGLDGHKLRLAIQRDVS